MNTHARSIELTQMASAIAEASGVTGTDYETWRPIVNELMRQAGVSRATARCVIARLIRKERRQIIGQSSTEIAGLPPLRNMDY